MALTDEQYAEIMRSYDRIRDRDHYIDEKNHDRIYSKIPELSKIDNDIASLSSDALNRSFNGTDQSAVISEAADRIRQLVSRKKDLLRQHGFSETDLSPHYECPDCKDTGFINNQECHCLKKKISDLIYDQYRISAGLNKFNFSDFSIDYYTDDLDPIYQKSGISLARTALRTSKEFVKKIENKEKVNSILLFGDTGTGKTFLSNCIANELLKNGKTVVYFTAIDFFNRLREISFSDSASENSQRLLDTDLIIIDDLGTENISAFTTSQLFNVINKRIIKEQPLVISTNLKINEIKEQYSERIYSRIISSFELLRLYGDDIRQKKRLREL